MFNADQYVGLGEIAKRLGISEYQVTRIFERGFLPATPRIGGRRIFAVADVDKMKEAAKKAGYLK